MIFLLIIYFCIILKTGFAQAGIISEVSGTVEIKRAGSSSFVTANAGDHLTQDTLISTGFRSTAIIETGTSSITVRPLTRLTLTEIQSSNDEETLNVNLQSGRVRVEVKPPTGSRAIMSITSPSATASVRGTSFEFDTRNLYVSDGSVSFMGNRGQQVRVNAGASSRVEGNSRAADPVEVKTASVIPVAPVGTDISVAIPSGPARTGVEFLIGLRFE